MQLSDFDFDLPERLIATRPAEPRSSARLLVAAGDAITDARVTDLPDWLRPLSSTKPVTWSPFTNAMTESAGC